MSPVEGEIVHLFVNLAQALGLPKSHGEIFGILFCAPEPICFEDVINRTGISKGSASQGLKLLQKINAIRQVYVARDRRTFYEAELRMRHLLAGFLAETVEPHLTRGAEHIGEIEALCSAPDSGVDPVLRERIHSLRNWNEKAASLLPWIHQVAGPSEEDQQQSGNKSAPPGNPI